MDALSAFDFFDEEIAEPVEQTPSVLTMRTMEELHCGSVVRVGRLGFRVFSTQGCVALATKVGTSGHKMYRLMPARDGLVDVHQVDGMGDVVGQVVCTGTLELVDA